jgi:pyruvate/2-oxoglutarate dehydrogenase complex dihydrolipoamide dehydrogenase (E3) component
MKHLDAIIIGTGQAGPSLAARFAAAGKTVAIIERHKFGGTCVNTGCIPTKTMVASAYAVHVARKSRRRALTTKYPMSRVSRAFEKGETQGFMKICIDAETKPILGAAILGTGGDEIIHTLRRAKHASFNCFSSSLLF